MAKDVDLSSKEWRDIVFEGKNKEYGAYEMRKNSDGRHNKAMLAVVLIAILAFVGTLVVSNIVANLEARPEDQTEQVMAEMGGEAEEEETDEPERVEEQKMETAPPEEVLNSVMMTELTIKKDEDVKNEMISQDQAKDDDRAVSTQNVDDGSDDLRKIEDMKTAIPEPPKEEKPKPVEQEKPLDVAEQMPVFPGGEAALLKWIAEHIKYPPVAMENNVQGRVVVKFVVTKTGSIGQVKVARGKDPDLDKEAVRVVKSLPKFTPGKQNGHPVDVWYTVPINFKLQGV